MKPKLTPVLQYIPTMLFASLLLGGIIYPWWRVSVEKSKRIADKEYVVDIQKDYIRIQKELEIYHIDEAKKEVHNRWIWQAKFYVDSVDTIGEDSGSQ